MVSVDFGYSNKSLFFTIEQLIKSDDKISNLEVKIENKKIEITKVSSKNKIEELSLEIERLKKELDTEKNSYKYLENRYDELEKKYNENETKKNKFNDEEWLCCMAAVKHHYLYKKSTGMANFEIAKPPKLPPYGFQCYAKITLFYPSRQPNSPKTKKG
ncbi:MAG: hypothetical protein U0X91_22825 [Spirosomataceae bacterium]